MEQLDNEKQMSSVRQPMHRRKDDDGKQFKLRQILNIIFMVGAVIGVIVYFAGSHTIGTIIILAAMVFKMAESAIRLIH